MFGHQAEPVQQNDNEQASFNDGDNSFVMGGSQPTAFPPADASMMSAPPQVMPQAPPVITDTNNLLEPQATDGFTGPAPAPDLTPSTPTDFGAPAPAPEPTPVPTVGTPGPLSDLKQQALQQLSPLVGQLEQTPEEKFRTTMMLIQASDNQDLLQTAYEAANQITDEKAKAQALLDVINEINYFSQK